EPWPVFSCLGPNRDRPDRRYWCLFIARCSSGAHRLLTRSLMSMINDVLRVLIEPCPYLVERHGLRETQTTRDRSPGLGTVQAVRPLVQPDPSARKSTRLNSSHVK